jgi:hypothetical protein
MKADGVAIANIAHSELALLMGRVTAILISGLSRRWLGADPSVREDRQQH